MGGVASWNDARIEKHRPCEEKQGETASKSPDPLDGGDNIQGMKVSYETYSPRENRETHSAQRNARRRQEARKRLDALPSGFADSRILPWHVGEQIVKHVFPNGFPMSTDGTTSSLAIGGDCEIIEDVSGLRFRRVEFSILNPSTGVLFRFAGPPIPTRKLKEEALDNITH